MTELLNLDELVSVKRTVTIKGNDYALADQTVDQMLDGINRANKAKDEASEMTVEQVLSEMKDTCQRILPDCPEDVIGSLNIKQLSALVEFASKPESEVSQVANDAQSDEAPEAGKPE